ncbi:MAG: type IIL restriction-modification enzyme MmeI [Burkholderiales bacterium]|nr:type IIL restriction-modification enzyme MmeI [Burkholderiales bacterium]
MLTPAEAETIRSSDPIAGKYIRPFLGADEFINNLPRFCLWLPDSTAPDRKESPELRRRIASVRVMRLASPKVPTQKLANTSHLFGEIRQTLSEYLLIPSVSSERRDYIPIGYLDGNVIASNLVFMLPNATLFHFGVLSSTMHNAWMRAVAGRMKSDYRYSSTIVYNNFSWPSCVTTGNSEQKVPSALDGKAQAAIETAAQAVLDARSDEERKCANNDQACSLADLYDPLTMPPALLKAHQKLDAAVDKAYEACGGKKAYKNDAERVAFLFELYQRQTSLLESPKVRGKTTRSQKAK